jgi:hypothetical protein
VDGELLQVARQHLADVDVPHRVDRDPLTHRSGHEADLREVVGASDHDTLAQLVGGDVHDVGRLQRGDERHDKGQRWRPIA